jgi:hypothetical protein
MKRNYAIVRVLNDEKLLDGAMLECQYRRPDGNGLPAGFYMVSWSADAEPHYDSSASFHGPFKLQLHAKMVLRRHLEGEAIGTPRLPGEHRPSV